MERCAAAARTSEAGEQHPHFINPLLSQCAGWGGASAVADGFGGYWPWPQNVHRGSPDVFDGCIWRGRPGLPFLVRIERRLVAHADSGLGGAATTAIAQGRKDFSGVRGFSPGARRLFRAVLGVLSKG